MEGRAEDAAGHARSTKLAAVLAGALECRVVLDPVLVDTALAFGLLPRIKRSYKVSWQKCELAKN